MTITAHHASGVSGSPENGYPREVRPIYTFQAPARLWSTTIHIGGIENLTITVPDDGVVRIASAVELVGDATNGGETDQIPTVYGRPVLVSDRCVAIAALRSLGFMEISVER